MPAQNTAPVHTGDDPGGSEKLALHPITLAFRDGRERSYLNRHFENSLVQVRIMLFLATCLYAVFYILDIIMVPDKKDVFFLIRFGLVIPFQAAVFIFSFSRAFRKVWQQTITVAFIIGGSGISMMLVVEPAIQTYYGGIMLVLITGYFFARLRFYLATLAGWTTILIYNVSALVYSDTIPEILIHNNFFFISANLIGMFAAYNNEYFERRDFYQNDLLDRRKAEVEEANHILEQKALLSMMNPHFIFNTLGSIQNYMLKNKPEDAALYLSQFARLIRQNLSAINNGMILLAEESDRLKNYLDLERLRLQNKFDYHISTEDEVEEDEILIPSMILQPILENAIWHGITGIEEKGMINIDFSYHSDNALKVVIRDNGIGTRRSGAASESAGKHLRLGTELTFKRLAIIGKRMNVETDIEVLEADLNSHNPGTQVSMIVPFSYL